MPTDKSLPGNPYSTRHNAWNDEGAIGDIVATEGLTDATLITSAIMAHRDAVMTLAHEQRTANLLALSVHHARTSRSHEALDAKVRARLGLDKEGQP